MLMLLNLREKETCHNRNYLDAISACTSAKHSKVHLAPKLRHYSMHMGGYKASSAGSKLFKWAPYEREEYCIKYHSTLF